VRLGEDELIVWELMGLKGKSFRELEFETGQIVLNKRKVWTALQMTKYLSIQAKYYFTVSIAEVFEDGCMFVCETLTFFFRNSLVIKKPFSGDLLLQTHHIFSIRFTFIVLAGSLIINILLVIHLLTGGMPETSSLDNQCCSQTLMTIQTIHSL
jgi:hypothetical protein